MKNTLIKKVLVAGLLTAILAISGFAQETKPVIFAVINDGKTIEPIAHIDGKKLVKTVTGDEEEAKKAAFEKAYFKKKSRYKLIFSGVNAGVVSVEDSDYKRECASNMAGVSVVSTPGTTLKGFVMGLATDLRTNKTASGIRRLPTPAQRSKYESYVRSEFIKQGIPKDRELKYHNLTAIDVDDTGIIELVGSFWADISPTERGLLFMIVDIEPSGKYTVTHKNYSAIKQREVMNEDITTLDSGIYHELLLDYFDYDNDGVSEIFTMTQGFEGTSFTVYKRKDGKWLKDFETANYHCGF